MMKQLAVGTKVALFEVQDEVGRGGIGVVYRCFDPVLKAMRARYQKGGNSGLDLYRINQYIR